MGPIASFVNRRHDHTQQTVGFMRVIHYWPTRFTVDIQCQLPGFNLTCICTAEMECANRNVRWWILAKWV